MMKKLFVLTLLAGFIFSCAQKTEKIAEVTVLEPTITELLSNPMDYDSAEVSLEGIISHVCKHAGDKMRVMQPDTELSVLVMLGDYTGVITPENEGQTVALNGMVTVNVANLDALGEEHKHDGEEHEEGEECASTEEAIAKLKEKGLDPDLRVVVDLKKYEIK
jgi:hypothetical protein